jgi:hypothetical protein
VHFGGGHGCGDDDAAAEEGTYLTAGTRTAELVTSPTCRVYFGGVHGCGDDDAAAVAGSCLTAGT